MPDIAETISVTGHGPPETLPGLGRILICCALAGWIVWLEHGVAKYALGIAALGIAPALARAVVAPFLARVLRNAAKGME